MPLRPHQLCGDEVHHALAPARALNAQHLAPLVDDVVNGLPLAVSEIRLRIRHRHAQQRLCVGSAHHAPPSLINSFELPSSPPTSNGGH